ARGGVASRRAAEQLIVEGRVTVNGQVMRELGSRADPAADVVAVDGVPIRLAAQHRYIMLHKPAGYVTTRSDPEGRPTVYDLLPDVPGLFSVGRLDKETEGLLLMTTDGDWAEKLAHPRHGLEREYEVRPSGSLRPGSIECLRAGIILDGRPARPAAVRELRGEGGGIVLSIVMTEGRRREVRLLCAGADILVKRLIRKRFGNLMLGWLAPGHWRNLSAGEVSGLVPRGPSAPPRPDRDPRRIDTSASVQRRGGGDRR
ncbi:MAG: pseudouridine synthase, partial [Chloroflexota bacterium]